MIIPYTKIKEYTQPVIEVINPTVSACDVYDVVMNYASMASAEYGSYEAELDEDWQFASAEKNIEDMLAKLNELFGAELSTEEVKKCVKYIMNMAEPVASEYINVHSFLKKNIVSGREFPEADVNYALVILAYEAYLRIFFLLTIANKDITYENMADIFADEADSVEYNQQKDRMRMDMDQIVMSHRKCISGFDSKPGPAKYFGQYTLTIENGKVAPPKFVLPDDNKIWVVTESVCDDEKITCCLIVDLPNAESYFIQSQADAESFKIRGLGRFVVGPDNMWEIPEIMLEHFKTKDITFFGVGQHVEIMSDDDMDYNTMQFEDVVELLKKIGD